MTFLTEEIMQGTDWRAVERAVARVMAHSGWSNVRIIGGSGDGGGDIIATRNLENRDAVFVVQVKAVTGINEVGPEAIQQALEAQDAYAANICVVATNGTFTRAAEKRRNQLQAQGFNVRLWNGRFLQDLLDAWPAFPHERRQLRPYQEVIVERCLNGYTEGRSRLQFVVATGLGKTIIAAEVLSRLFARGFKRALVLCHMQDLALQLEQGFWNQLDKSVPTSVFFDGSMPRAHDGVNFGLYQTFNHFLNAIDPDEYDVVFVDEAHHALAYDFRRCISHLKPHLLIGMTATPWRADGTSLNTVFGSPIAQVSLVDGMKMGYLARADYRIYCDTIDWDEVRSKTRGQATISDLNKRIFVPQRDEAIVEELVRRCRDIPNPRVIIFCASIEHGKRFANLLTALSPFVCKQLSGLGKIERNRILMEFASGRVHAVTAVDVLNEGIDVPDVNVIVFLRNTHSRRIFIQQLGRGLRLAPGKEKLLVLDFVTDIRRLAEVLRMDREAREITSGLQPYRELFFPGGIVTFVNEAALPFTQQWLKDIADLSDSEDTRILEFPEAL